MTEPTGGAEPGGDKPSALSRLKPFSLEIALLVEIALFQALLAWRDVEFLPRMIVYSLTAVPPRIATLMLGGLAVRLAWLAGTGRRSEAWSWIRDVRWWLRSARYLVIGALLTHFYTWLKVFVPVIHRRLFDAQLYDLDRIVMFGFQPSVFFLNLFSGSSAISVIDRGYGELFFAVLAFSVAFFLSSRDESTRRVFVAGFVVLWSLGAWLYLVVPALGPAYAFPEEFMRFREQLRGSVGTQGVLFRNYQQIHRFALGSGETLINPVLGIAAFPSLHVGHVAFVAILLRRVAKATQLPLALAVALMFVGSIVTGWHYMVDSIAGIVLAWLSVRAGVWFAKQGAATADG